jgi:hypothetical protein
MTTAFNLNARPVRCPLCHGFLERHFDKVRAMFVLICEIDKIGIAAGDPFVGKWEQAYEKLGEDEKLRCPQDDSVMRFFCTSTGYMKFKCAKKKCGVAMALSEPDRDKATNLGTSTKGLLEKPS